jgi:hypothetical protein
VRREEAVSRALLEALFDDAPESRWHGMARAAERRGLCAQDRRYGVRSSLSGKRSLYAFHTSLGGQPLFGHASLED